jgi:hypothetical protein
MSVGTGTNFLRSITIYEGESNEKLGSSKKSREIRENSRVKVNEVAATLNASHSSAHHIIHDVLQFRKVSTRWVPR